MHQIKGWGEASTSLCARAVAEVQALCQSSFRGVELGSPNALCCTRGCASILGTLQDLSTEALDAGDADAVTTCAHGHHTLLQSFVGMLPGAEDGHAAELLYWLRIVQHHVHHESATAAAAVGIDDVDDASDGDTITSQATPPVYTSLATALVRWTAHTFREAGATSSACPRVWVAVRHDDNHSPTLVLRPVCEHPQCLHAVRTQSRRRAMNDVTSLVAAALDCGHGSRTSSVPLRMLAERSGRVLAALTLAVAYGDEDMQTLRHEHILSAVEAMLTVLPIDAQAPVGRLSKLHKALRKPLRWVQVVAHQPRVGDGAGHAQSHLWLCKHHAEHTELAQSRVREKRSVEVVTMLVEWYWHDGQRSRVFDRMCTATLEHAFQSKLPQATLRCRDHMQTVQFLASGMVVKESGARVGRVSLKTYVFVCVCDVKHVDIMCHIVWNNAVTRHPFPPHWHVQSSDNFTQEDLTSGPEFDDVQQRLHDSLPDATLIRVTRCVDTKCSIRSACMSRTQYSRFVLHLKQHSQPLPMAAILSAM